MLLKRMTELAQSADRGDAYLSDEFFAPLYDELHLLARRELRRGRGLLVDYLRRRQAQKRGGVVAAQSWQR